MLKKILSCWYLVLVAVLCFCLRLPNWLFFTLACLIFTKTFIGFFTDFSNVMQLSAVQREPWYVFQSKSAVVLALPLAFILFRTSWPAALVALVACVLCRGFLSVVCDILITMPTSALLSRVH